MEILTIKRGESFALSCTYKVDNVATAITGLTVRAQLRRAAKFLVQELEFVDGGATGIFFFRATAAQTKEWGVNNLSCDIRITDAAGIVRLSDSFGIAVAREITE